LEGIKSEVSKKSHRHESKNYVKVSISDMSYLQNLPDEFQYESEREKSELLSITANCIMNYKLPLIREDL
jgi:hypothetical protein